MKKGYPLNGKTSEQVDWLHATTLRIAKQALEEGDHATLRKLIVELGRIYALRNRLKPGA